MMDRSAGCSAIVGALAPMLMLGCAEPTDIATRGQPIVNGTTTDGHPSVVAVVSSSNEVRCTGTLIAERVVLTAAHCGVQGNESTLAVFVGTDVNAGGERIAVLHARHHPKYDATATNDLALLLLASAASPKPAALRTTAPALMSPLRIVGFGRTDPTSEVSGRKLEGQSVLRELASHHLVLGAQPSLPCRGDSGGPVFSGDALAAVISRGDADCSDYAKATRVDVHAAFIQSFIAATAPGSADAGSPCLYDDQCTTGRCVFAIDEPLARYCSALCRDGTQCPPAMHCTGGECRYRLPTPGAMGSRCTNDAGCLRGQCLPEGVCSVRCVDAGDCPSGSSCKHRGGINFFCIVDPPARVRAGGGGCSAGGGDGGPVLLVLLLTFAGAARARRAAAGAGTPA